MRSVLFTKDDESKIAYLITVMFSYNVVTLTFNSFVNLIFPNTPFDTALCMLAYAYFIMRAIKPIASRINVADVLFVFFCAFVYLASMFVLPDNREYLEFKCFDFLVKILPFYLVGRAVGDYEKLLNCLVRASKYVVFIGFAYYLLTILSGRELIKDNMAFAYYYLPFAILSIYSLVKSFTPMALLRVGVSIGTLVLAGTRGPFVCIAVALVAFTVIYQKSKVAKVLLSAGIIALGMFMLSERFTEMLESINDFLLQHDIENRIIEKFLEDEMADSSGRDKIVDSILSALQERPFTGYGLMGDRAFADGIYAHNIFYELIASYGWFFGTGLFIAVTLIVVRAVLSHKASSSYRAVAIFVVSYIFVKLFLSSSFLLEPAFFLMLGIVFNFERRKEENDGLRN